MSHNPIDTDAIMAWASHACIHGGCQHEKGTDCYYDLHEAAEMLAAYVAELLARIEHLEGAKAALLKRLDAYTEVDRRTSGRGVNALLVEERDNAIRELAQLKGSLGSDLVGTSPMQYRHGKREK